MNEQIFTVHLLDDPYEDNPYGSEQAVGTGLAGESNSSDYEQFGMIDSSAGWAVAETNEMEQFAGFMGSSDVNMTIDDGLRIYAALTVVENEPVGALVGQFQAYDRDDWAVLTYSLIDGEGSGDNHLFNLDSDGRLHTSTTFDYESNASEYSIRLRATDERNTSTERAFTVYLLDEFEDLDGDNIEDHLDEDMDGDGYPNQEELAYGSNPRMPVRSQSGSS